MNFLVKDMVAAIPSPINPMLAIFDQTTLPMTIPLSCFREAMTEDVISGIDVPTATKLNPITNSEISGFFAMDAADLTKKSEPLMT